MIHYIAYSNLGEFYTLQEVCHMLEMSKDELRKNCEKYNVKPSRNEIGDWGLPCHDLCRLHNYLYKGGRNRYTAENHRAAGTKNDRATIDPGVEDWP